jgi:prophage antirepressor-like protein
MDCAVFQFGECRVRVIDANGGPWFSAGDVGEVLGIAQVNSTLRAFPEDEKGVHSMHTPGGNQQISVVSEPGLYRLIFQSRKPSAEAFKKWVFGEVLPSLRKTGAYAIPAGQALAAAAAAMKGTVEEAARRVLAGTLTVPEAKAVAALAGRWAEVHRHECAAYGPKGALPAPAPAEDLLDVMDAARWGHGLGLWGAEGRVWQGQAAELAVLLCASDCTESSRARKILREARLERLLGELRRRHPERVAYHRSKRARGWRISPPPAELG